MAVQNGSVSRRGFIALAGGSVAAASALSACGSESSANAETADFGDGDLGILNFLLGIEYVLADFYAELSDASFFDEEMQLALGQFGEQEQEHVDAVLRQIKKAGGKADPKPGTKFSLGSEKEALEIGNELENIAAAAYLGQLPKIEGESLRLKMVEIHSVEGRHAAALAYLLGAQMTPDGAFAKPATVDTVMAALKPYTA